jgi:hypothetical protein
MLLSLVDVKAVVEPDDRGIMLYDYLLNSNDLFPPRFRLSFIRALLFADSLPAFIKLAWRQGVSTGRLMRDDPESSLVLYAEQSYLDRARRST